MRVQLSRLGDLARGATGEVDGSRIAWERAQRGAEGLHWRSIRPSLYPDQRSPGGERAVRLCQAAGAHAGLTPVLWGCAVGHPNRQYVWASPEHPFQMEGTSRHGGAVKLPLVAPARKMPAEARGGSARPARRRPPPGGNPSRNPAPS